MGIISVGFDITDQLMIWLYIRQAEEEMEVQ
jgi:hypothetical protein